MKFTRKFQGPLQVFDQIASFLRCVVHCFGKQGQPSSSPTENVLSEEEEEHSELFKEYAMAIGFVCVEWAKLELSFDRLLRIMMGWSHRSDVTHAITINIDMQSKMKIVQAVGFIIPPSNPPEWFSDLQHTCGTIENRLRPLRNRFVHDVWIGDSQEPFTRRTRTTKFFRPQSFRSLELSVYTDTPTPIAEVWDLVRSIIDVSNKLNALATTYYDFLNNPH